jgi:hypothetical protein
MNGSGTGISLGRTDRGGDYRVVPVVTAGSGNEVYVVVTPSGVPLYSFEDLREASGEASLLNLRRAGSRRLSLLDRSGAAL